MENIDAKTRELVGALSINGGAAQETLNDWFCLFPESLWRVAGSMGPKVPFSVQKLLASDANVCAGLCNPDILSEQASKDLAKSLIRFNPRLDIRLGQAAVEWTATSGSDRRMIRRCLAILEVLSSGSRINSALVQLLNCGNEAVRSKVVELLVRWSTNEGNVREWLRDPDPRVRANVLEALAEIGHSAEWIRDLLMEHINDRHGRAAANAAVGLYRLGVPDPAVTRLSEMARSGDAGIRCSAVWGMGQVPDPRLLDTLNQLRTDPDSRVRWLALKSLSSFNRAGVKFKQVVATVEEPVVQQTEEPQAATPEPPAPPPPPAPVGPTFTTRTFGRLL